MPGGNPNVGKSSLFNALTGAGSDTANCVGVTTEACSVSVHWGGRRVEVIDLPGTYSLDGPGGDQRAARAALLTRRPDVVVAVADATNLARSLYLPLQLADLGFRLVIAVNLSDEARRRDREVDAEALAREFGMPVVTTVAPRRIGLAKLEAAALRVATSSNGLGRGQQTPLPADVAADAWWRLTTSPRTGIPILLGVIVAMFATLFVVGDRLARALTTGWSVLVSPSVTALVTRALGDGAVGRTVLWGVDGGILATLAVGIPNILTFYFILALVEDSGYMNAAAFLSDRVMHRFGLHGRAVIPLIAAGGCNVPAIIATRTLPTMR